MKNSSKALICLAIFFGLVQLAPLQHPSLFSPRPSCIVFSSSNSDSKDENGLILTKGWIDKSRTIPYVLTGLNYAFGQQGRAAKETIPFHCERNDQIIVLTNTQQAANLGPCVQTVDISKTYSKSVAEAPKTSSQRQNNFFDRWYVLRDWMRASGTPMVFVSDSDALVTINVTRLVHDNVQVMEQHKIWAAQENPRTTFQFAFVTLDFLEDFTAVCNKLFHPEYDLWHKKKTIAANDMIVLGHYAKLAEGPNFSCWANDEKWGGPKPGCESPYGMRYVLDRLRAANITAKYTLGNLQLNQNIESVFTGSIGVVDKNYRHDPTGFFEMSEGEKKLRFVNGQPQMKLTIEATAARNDKTLWYPIWGYILEDELEQSASYHLERIRNKETCTCTNFHCHTCETFMDKDGTGSSKNVLDGVTVVTSPLHCTNHGSNFLGWCICHPGYTGPDCREKLFIPNPHWIEASEYCPNLNRDVTYTKDDDDGHDRFACYYSESGGITAVPTRLWKKAQNLEFSVWSGRTATSDRADTHITSFEQYKALENHHFGETLEIGCGPWTQLIWIADTLSLEKLGLEKTTLLEPNGKKYMREVPTCSYKDGTLLGKPIELLAIGGEELRAAEQFDTVVSINVLDHVQDVLQLLNNTYHAVKPGGVLIWHDRWFDSPFGCRTKKDNMGITLHPIRPKFKVLAHFLSGFEPMYQNVMVERMDSSIKNAQCDGGQIYFIGRKKK